MASDTLEGQCLVLFAVTMFFCIVCFVMITLRCCTRICIKGFGSDDWLMLIGTVLISDNHEFWSLLTHRQVFGTMTFITVLCGCKVGLGQHDYDLAEGDYSKIKRVRDPEADILTLTDT